MISTMIEMNSLAFSMIYTTINGTFWTFKTLFIAARRDYKIGWTTLKDAWLLWNPMFMMLFIALSRTVMLLKLPTM